MLMSNKEEEEKERKNPKEYLGDAVYAEFDGCGIMLTTEDGISTTNSIYLEPEILALLNFFYESVSTYKNIESA